MSEIVPLACAVGGLTVAGITYFLSVDTESVCQDFSDIKILGGLQKEMFRLAARKSFSAVELFQETAKRLPHRPAMIYLDDASGAIPYSWKEMDVISNQVANWGLSLGLKAGDHISILMDNRPEMVIFWIGMAKIGVQSALINTHLAGKPLHHSLSISGAKAHLVGREHVEKCVDIRSQGDIEGKWFSSGSLKELFEQKEFINGFEDIDSVILSQESTQPKMPTVAPNAPFLFIYTSGTTGLPKAATVNSLRYTSAAKGFSNAFKVTDEDRIYCCLPLYHSAAGMLGVGTSWASGATIVLRKKFSARNFWKDCAAFDCTTIQYIGELCRYLVNVPESPYDRQHRVRLAVGNGLRPDVWGKFQNRFGITQIGEFYGATEGNCALVNMRNKFGSVGNLPRALSKLSLAPFYLFKFDVETETVLRDKDGRCIRCGPDEVGEMMGRIDVDKNPMSRFDGYQNKEATKKKVVCDVEKKGDQWFRTGDLLYFDRYGNYYFVDRIGDTFRWKGENVSTNEVAEVVSGMKGFFNFFLYLFLVFSR